jgi:hypothetical protein
MTGQAIVTEQPAREIAWASWLTVERAAYAGIALLALVVRLIGLGWFALGPAEAQQALPALTAANGYMPDLAGVSPLLYSLQRGLFMLFGATEIAARFWPALLGGLSVLAIYPLRRWLTPGGAVVAAALWGVAPLAVWSSRVGLGDALVPALALAALAAAALLIAPDDELPGAETAEAHGRRGAAVAFGASLGLLLISGKNAYTVLLAAAVVLVWQREAARRLWAAVRAERRSVLLAFFVTAVFGSTFLFLTPAGLAAAISLAGQWLQAIIPGTGEYSAWEIVRRLLISELLLLGFGLAGVIWSILHRNRSGIAAGVATGIALLAPLIGRGRNPIDLSLVVLGLALLAGPAVARVLAAAWDARTDTDAWLLIGLSAALLLSASFALPSAANPANTAEWRQVFTGVGIGAALVVILAWVAYGAYGNWDTVRRALPLLLVVIGLAWGIGQLVALSYDRGAWRQAAVLHVTAAPDTADLQAELRDIVAEKGTGAREAPIDIAWPNRPGDPLLVLLRWQLRNYPGARYAAAVPADPASIVITPVGENAALADGYSGAEFPLLQSWDPGTLDSASAEVRWVLMREAKTQPEKQGIIIWVKRNEE